MLSREIEERVIQRAHGRCEYCRRTLKGERGEIDHIRPRSKDGSNQLRNLALACAVCNGNKGDTTEAEDPVFGTTVPLFHPRRDAWETHFAIIGGVVTGQTAIGRATAALLFRLTPRHIPRDLHWDWLDSLDDERMYNDLNRLRALRLANRFPDLERGLAQRVTAVGSSRELISFLHYLLGAEMLMARGRPAELDHGVRLARRALRRFGDADVDRRRQIYSVLGGFRGRKGTLLALEGQMVAARQCWQEAVLLREASGPWRKSSAFEHALRVRGNAARFGDDTGPLAPSMFRFAEEHAGNANYRPLVAVCDIALSGSSAAPFDRLLDIVTRTLERSAYGSDRDHAATVVLRRRWWGLLIAAGERPDLDLLRRDMALWQRIEMFNELRELQWMLRMPWVARRKETDTIIRVGLTLESAAHASRHRP